MSDPQRLSEGFRLLRGRDFSRLFAARAVSALGTGMAFVALPFAVLEVVGSENPGPVGYVVASATLAQLSFQLFAGALADRGSRQRMMVLGDALATVSQAAFAVVLLTGQATGALGIAAAAIVIPTLLVLGVPEVRNLRSA